MSHSTTLVVIRGAHSAAEAEERLEDLLKPFDENIEIDPPLQEWVDDDVVQRAVKYYKENPESCDGDDGPATTFDKLTNEVERLEWTRQAVGAYHGGADRGILKQEDGEYVFGYLSTYNPDSKWDWWTLGGRWHGFFQLKPQIRVGGEPLPEWRKATGPVGSKDGRVDGVTTLPEFDGTHDAILGGGGVFGDDAGENFQGRADLARKGDIDFEAMRVLAGRKADAHYDAFEKATKDLPLPLSWQDTLKRFLGDVGIEVEVDPVSLSEDELVVRQKTIENARSFYNGQEWIQALRQAQLDSFFGDPLADWCVHTGGRQTYVERARNNATSTFAVLLDGEWYERGHMGWWGMVSDEKDGQDWAAEHWKLIKDLPDDVYLAVVDCHI